MWQGSRPHISRNNDINITTGPGADSSHLFFYFHHRREYSRPSWVHFPIEIMRYGNDLWTRLTDSFRCELDIIRYYYFIEAYSIIASKYHHAVNVYSVSNLNLSNPHKASVRRSEFPSVLWISVEFLCTLYFNNNSDLLVISSYF